MPHFLGLGEFEAPEAKQTPDFTRGTIFAWRMGSQDGRFSGELVRITPPFISAMITWSWPSPANFGSTVLLLPPPFAPKNPPPFFFEEVHFFPSVKFRSW